MAAAEVEAAKNSWPMVIAIVDSTGHLLALHRMHNGSYGSIKIAIGKAQTAFEFRQPTKNYNEQFPMPRLDGLGLIAYWK
jgi:glc operon protein GlcG